MNKKNKEDLVQKWNEAPSKKQKSRFAQLIAIARLNAASEGPETDFDPKEIEELTGPTEHSLNAFDLCVKDAGLKQDEMDIWGVHNWHSNLMAVLSVGAGKLMSREQFFAVVRKRLPNYAKTEDCRKLINYFYDKYDSERGYMSANLREINAKAQAPMVDEDEEDREMEKLREGWNPPDSSDCSSSPSQSSTIPCSPSRHSSFWEPSPATIAASTSMAEPSQPTSTPPS